MNNNRYNNNKITVKLINKCRKLQIMAGLSLKNKRIKVLSVGNIILMSHRNIKKN